MNQKLLREMMGARPPLWRFPFVNGSLPGSRFKKKEAIYMLKDVLLIPSGNSTEAALHRVLSEKKSDFALVICHGITYSGIPVYDTPVEGKSFAERFADLGYDVYIPDFVGYGASVFDHNTKVDFNSAVQDLTACMKHIHNMRNYEAVFLLGWSWGAQVAGYYAMNNPTYLTTLILYGFKWHINKNLIGRVNTLWRKNTIEHVLADFTQPDTILQDVMEKYAKKALETDSESPNGPRLDIDKRNYYVSPERILIPTLLVQGHNDTGLDMEDSIKFFQNLRCKKYYSIIYGAHPIHLEVNYRMLISGIDIFCRNPFNRKKNQLKY